jgi:hypothetical protein
MSTFILIYIITALAFLILSWEWRQLPRRELKVKLILLRNRVKALKEKIDRLKVQLRKEQESFAEWEAK